MTLLTPDLAEDERRRRRALGVATLVLFVAAVVPPLSSWSRHYEFAQALQYSLLAIVVPWGAARAGIAERATGRRRGPVLSLAGLMAYGLAAVIWRAPWCVNGLARHPWLLLAEVVTLLTTGIFAWSCLLNNPRRPAALTPVRRLASAALVMWSIWVMAYLVGLSHGQWYPAYHHTGSLSISADQQVTTAILWAVSGVAFVPIVFANFSRWLRAGHDSHDELAQRILADRLANSSLP